MSLSFPSAGRRSVALVLSNAVGRVRRASVWWIALALAAAFVVASLYFDRGQSFTPPVIRFLDPDDALRLAQVRNLYGDLEEDVVATEPGVVLSWVECGWVAVGAVTGTIAVADGVAL